MENLKNLETAEANAKFNYELPDSVYRQTIRPKGKKRGWRDFFGQAVSECERTLLSKEAKERKQPALTLSELIEQSERIEAAEKRQGEREKIQRMADKNKPVFSGRCNW